MFSLLRGKEQHHLTRSVDIVASLASITGVCALDREGTLCAVSYTCTSMMINTNL
jgi:hypothetical protein